VSEPTPLLDRKGIEEAFCRLGDRLAKRGVVADICVFGGAAMALAYDSRRATRDVDAFFKPHGIVLEEAQGMINVRSRQGWRGPERVAGEPRASMRACSYHASPGLGQANVLWIGLWMI
jgi:hypothetical protein